MALTAASASALSPPAVYLRPIGESSEPLGPWQASDAPLTSLGSYQIGVGIQPTPDISNRQAIEVDVVSMPGGPPPADFLDHTPYTPYCSVVTDAYGPIAPTDDVLFFHGDGAYTLKVSAFTFAQWNARSGSTCSGGQESVVNLTANATAGVSVVGTPLVPRTTRQSSGFDGIQFTAPPGATGDRWRCARDPVRAADGSFTGSVVVSSPSRETSGLALKHDESLFTGPGRWACSVQILGRGLTVLEAFPTPWASTPTFLVRGQFDRDPRRTVLTRLPRHHLRLVVPATRQVAAAAAGGRLTFALYRAECRGRGMALHRVSRKRAVVDSRGVARFTFVAPTLTGYYLGRPVFGGSSLLLAGPGFDMTMRLAYDPADPRAAPVFGFVNPSVWVPC